MDPPPYKEYEIIVIFEGGPTPYEDLSLKNYKELWGFKRHVGSSTQGEGGGKGNEEFLNFLEVLGEFWRPGNRKILTGQ